MFNVDISNEKIVELSIARANKIFKRTEYIQQIYNKISEAAYNGYFVIKVKLERNSQLMQLENTIINYIEKEFYNNICQYFENHGYYCRFNIWNNDVIFTLKWNTCNTYKDYEETQNAKDY